jgi:hypothetical protein
MQRQYEFASQRVATLHGEAARSTIAQRRPKDVARGKHNEQRDGYDIGHEILRKSRSTD